MKYAIYYKFGLYEATRYDFEIFNGLNYHEGEDAYCTPQTYSYNEAIDAIVHDIIIMAHGDEFTATYIMVPYNDNGTKAFHGVDDLKALHVSAEPMTKVTITSDDEGTDTIEKIV